MENRIATLTFIIKGVANWERINLKEYGNRALADVYYEVGHACSLAEPLVAGDGMIYMKVDVPSDRVDPERVAAAMEALFGAELLATEDYL